MDIEYDPAKAESNLSKHGVSFEEAASALLDPNALAQEDIYSEGETRWILMGMSEESRLLVVVYSLPTDERIRLISARTATKAEAKYYAR
ncbi:MAG: BrnT family toxin [Gammaproteobacteria bacterium]